MPNNVDLSKLTPAKREQLLQELALHMRGVEASQRAARFHSPAGAVEFVRERLGIEPTGYQAEILKALVAHQRVAVRAPHGAGKSTVAAMAILWAVLAHDDNVTVLTTAPTHRQLEKMLWGEIRRLARLADTDGQLMRVLNTQLQFPGQNKLAFAASSDDPQNLEGVHNQRVLIVFDEAKALDNALFDALEGAFSTGDAYALVISTPGAPQGRFYDIHAKRPGYADWHTIHVTLEDAIAAGRINRKWAENRALQWGTDSPVYQNRVLGEFADSGEDNIIPLSWVEAAQARWHTLGGTGVGRLVIGVDPARYGSDRTAIARLRGDVLERLDYYDQLDTMQVSGRVAAAAHGDTPIGVDTIGIGAGVYDRLRELNFNKTLSIKASAAPRGVKGLPREQEFVNLRAALWFLLKARLNPANEEALALPDDDILLGDLLAPGYDYDSKGRIVVESKKDLLKRIGRSTDGADALALALYAQQHRGPRRLVSASGLYRHQDEARKRAEQRMRHRVQR